MYLLDEQPPANKKVGCPHVLLVGIAKHQNIQHGLAAHVYELLRALYIHC